jgi:hypothetical protein
VAWLSIARITVQVWGQLEAGGPEIVEEKVEKKSKTSEKTRLQTALVVQASLLFFFLPNLHTPVCRCVCVQCRFWYAQI